MFYDILWFHGFSELKTLALKLVAVAFQSKNCTFYVYFCIFAPFCVNQGTPVDVCHWETQENDITEPPKMPLKCPKMTGGDIS